MKYLVAWYINDRNEAPYLIQEFDDKEEALTYMEKFKQSGEPKENIIVLYELNEVGFL